MPPETDLEQTAELAKAAAEAVEALKKAGNLDEAGRKVLEYKNAWEALQAKLERVKTEGGATREEISKLEASTSSARRVFEEAAKVPPIRMSWALTF